MTERIALTLYYKMYLRGRIGADQDAVDEWNIKPLIAYSIGRRDAALPVTATKTLYDFGRSFSYLLAAYEDGIVVSHD